MKTKLVSCLRDYVRFMKGEQENALDRASSLDPQEAHYGERDMKATATKIAQAKVLLIQLDRHGRVLS